MRDSREKGAGMRDQDPPSRPRLLCERYPPQKTRWFETVHAERPTAHVQYITWVLTPKR